MAGDGDTGRTPRGAHAVGNLQDFALRTCFKLNLNVVQGEDATLEQLRASHYSRDDNEEVWSPDPHGMRLKKNSISSGMLANDQLKD